MGSLEILELRLKEGMVATPAVDEHQWRIPIAFLLVIKTQSIPLCIWHALLLPVLSSILAVHGGSDSTLTAYNLT
jgi:hypothetical protein